MRVFIRFLPLVAAAACAVATAAPNADQAQKFERDLNQVMGQAALNLDTPAKQRAHQAKLQELEKRAARLFGGVLDPQYGSCVKAVGAIRTEWTNQMVLVTRHQVEPRDLALLATAMFEAGKHQAACSDAIDALAPATPKECLAVFDLSKPGAPAKPLPAHCPQPKL